VSKHCHWQRNLQETPQVFEWESAPKVALIPAGSFPPAVLREGWGGVGWFLNSAKALTQCTGPGPVLVRLGGPCCLFPVSAAAHRSSCSPVQPCKRWGRGGGFGSGCLGSAPRITGLGVLQGKPQQPGVN